MHLLRELFDSFLSEIKKNESFEKYNGLLVVRLLHGEIISSWWDQLKHLIRIETDMDRSLPASDEWFRYNVKVWFPEPYAILCSETLKMKKISGEVKMEISLDCSYGFLVPWFIYDKNSNILRYCFLK